MAEHELTISLRRPLLGSASAPLLSEWTFGARGIQASWTTTLDAGFGELTVVAPEMFHGLPVESVTGPRADVVPYAHVEADLDGDLVWAGRIKTFKLAGAQIAGFSAVGYALGTTHELFNGADGQALDVLKAAMLQTAPYVTLAPRSEVTDPDYTLTSKQTANLYLADIIKLVNQNGSSEGWPVRCQIWDAQMLSLMVRRPPFPPAMPRWLIPADQGLQPDDLDCDQIYGAIKVQGIDSMGGTIFDTTSQQQAFQGRYGLPRTLYVNNGGFLNQMQANGKAALASKTTLQTSGSWSTTRGVCPLPGGQTLPVSLMRAGDWALVEGFGIREIISTQMQYPGGGFSCQWGLQAPDAKLFQQISDVSNALIRSLNPNSWQRQG